MQVDPREQKRRDGWAPQLVFNSGVGPGPIYASLSRSLCRSFSLSRSLCRSHSLALALALFLSRSLSFSFALALCRSLSLALALSLSLSLSQFQFFSCYCYETVNKMVFSKFNKHDFESNSNVVVITDCSRLRPVLKTLKLNKLFECSLPDWTLSLLMIWMKPSDSGARCGSLLDLFCDDCNEWEDNIEDRSTCWDIWWLSCW